MSWTDERIEQLRKMWEGGMTASQIADELGGVSRNAVIGKAHRLGLQSRPSPVKPGEHGESNGTDAPKPVVAAAPVTPRPVARPAPPSPAPEASTPPATPQPPQPLIRSIGPGGFQRAMPGEQQAPSSPAPP